MVTESSAKMDLSAAQMPVKILEIAGNLSHLMQSFPEL